MKKLMKKGFTIVELVIVIAVIAILTAVLIPTISSVTHKAQVSADTQLIKLLNTSLKADEAKNGKPKYMQQALDIVAADGFDVAKINAKASKNSILWDSVNNAFCYLKENELEYVPNSVRLELNVDSYKLWTIASVPHATYSTYLYNLDPGVTEFTLVHTGIDVGNENVSSIEYVGGTSPQEAVIRTTSANTSLTINAGNDTVNHFGAVGKVDAQNVDLYHCYNEYGTAAYVKITNGKVVAKDGSEIAVVFANNTDSSKVAVAKESEGVIKRGLTTAEVVDTNNFANYNVHLEYSADGTTPFTVDEIEATGKLSVASETGVLPEGMNYTAVVNNVGYDTLSEAIETANAGDTVSLLKNVTITTQDAMGEVSYYWKSQKAKKDRPAGVRFASVGIIIDKSLVINGNGHTVTTTTKNNTKGDYAGVSLAIVASNVDLTLKNISMTTTEMSSVYVGENVTGVKLTVDGSELKSASYTIKTCNGADNGVYSITNSTLYGWATVNARGNNCTFTVKNSDLSGENTVAQSSSNNYASFVIDGDTLNDSETVAGTYGSNNAVYIYNTKISATSASANSQTWLSIQYGAKNNSVTVDTASVLTQPSVWTYTDLSEGQSNKVKVGGVAYSGVLEED